MIRGIPFIPCVIAAAILSAAPVCCLSQTSDDYKKQIDEVAGQALSSPEGQFDSVFTKAEEGLQALLAKEPANSEAWAQLGRAQFYLRRDADSQHSYSKCLEIDPKNIIALRNMGLRAAEKQNFSEAEKWLRQLIDAHPENEDGPEILMRVLVEQERIDDAKPIAGHLLKHHPGNAEALYFLGVQEGKIANHQAAVDYFERAVKTDPDLADAHYNAAQSYQSMDKPELALPHIEEVLRIVPDDTQSMAKRIQFQEALKDSVGRDASIKAIYELHDRLESSGADVEPFYCRDQFKVGSSSVMVYERYKLEGDKAVRWTFFVTPDGAKEPAYKISLGSYEATNSYAIQSGAIRPDQRRYHLDRYFDGGHETLGFFTDEPPYEDIKARVTEGVAGGFNPLSSTTAK